jgi:thiamine kinase-like enzyme
MEFENSHNLYMMMMYVYMKAYREALIDFEVAVKNSSFADLALMSVQQKYKEKIERIESEIEIS